MHIQLAKRKAVVSLTQFLKEILIESGYVLAVSNKKKIVTTDATDAELEALSDLISIVEQCDKFVSYLAMTGMKIPIILQVNMSTISLVTKGGGKPRAKHPRVRQHLINHKFSGKGIIIMYTSITKMLADAMMKPLGGGRSIGVRSADDLLQTKRVK